jgi:peptidoglycan/LPS O-acetylase OafA/YrhL
MTTATPDITAIDANQAKHGANHLSCVDSLRGIAAIYVVCFHVAAVPNPNLHMPNWARPMVMSGGTGVVMFFIVSAFTLSLSWFSRPLGGHQVRSFYIRRIFRIVPLFYILMAVTILRDWLKWHQPHSIKQIFLNALMLFNLVPGQSTGIVWASWTIGVEMLFYLLFPLIIKAKQTYLFACFLGTIFLSVLLHLCVQQSTLSSHLKAEYLSTTFVKALPVFVLGIATFAFYGSRMFTRRWPKWAGSTLVAVALLLHVLFSYAGAYSGNVGAYWSAPAWALLLLGLIKDPTRVLVNAVTRFYGKISYSLYLDHPIFVVLLMPFYARIYGYVSEPLLAFCLCCVTTLALLTPSAYVTYLLIEQPGIGFGRRLIKLLDRPLAN